MVTKTVAFRTTTAPSTIFRTTTVATYTGDDEDHDEDRHDYVGDVDHVRATTDAHETTVIETMAEGSPRRIGRTDDEERGQWRSWFR